MDIKCPKCNMPTELRHGLQPYCDDCEIVSLNYNVREGTATEWRLLDSYLADCEAMQDEINAAFDNCYF